MQFRISTLHTVMKFLLTSNQKLHSISGMMQYDTPLTQSIIIPILRLLEFWFPKLVLKFPSKSQCKLRVQP